MLKFIKRYVSYILLFGIIIHSCGPKSLADDNFNKSKDEFEIVEPINDFPESIGFVNDFDNILLPEQEDSLRDIIINYKISSNNEIAIATIDSIGSYNSIKDYAKDLGNYWGVGNNDEDNGVLILVCNPIRKIYIATGIGTEKIISNEEVQIIINDFIVPDFKYGNYYLGLKSGIEQLILEWEK